MYRKTSWWKEKNFLRNCKKSSWKLHGERVDNHAIHGNLIYSHYSCTVMAYIYVCMEVEKMQLIC